MKKPPLKKFRYYTFLLILAALLIILSLFVYREVYFTGPVVPPEALPEHGIIDAHVHVAGYGNGNSGCYVSPALSDNFRFDLFLSGFDVSRDELQKHGDQLVVDKIAAQISASHTVDAVVLLALDGVIDKNGELDLSRTEIYIPNDYVANQVKRYPELFHFGASINPNRKNAISLLEKVHQQGAVLIKWIPNIQHIDPSSKTLIPFYTRMKQLGLVLLSHTGQERAFSSARDEYGDPKLLQLPLSLGVKVIAAHIGTTGKNENEDNFERLLPMFSKWPNLYADISSLTQINKLGFLNKALVDPRLRERLIYGSDFPLTNMPITSAYFFPMNLTVSQMRHINSIKNHWDRDVSLKQALGLPADVFLRSSQILGLGTDEAFPDHLLK